MHVVRVNNSIIRASLKLHKLSFHKLAPRCATLLSPNVVVLFFWLSEFPCVAERVVPIFNFKHIIKAIWVQHIYWFKYFQQNNTETSGQHGWGFSCWHEVFVKRFIISINYTWSLFLFFCFFVFVFDLLFFPQKYQTIAQIASIVYTTMGTRKCWDTLRFEPKHLTALQLLCS